MREWFADWPKEHLAQIYSGGEVGDEKFCGNNFKLGVNERRFGNLFFKIKSSEIGQSSYQISLDNSTKLNKISAWALFKKKISSCLVNSGLWELIFKPKLSKEMIEFIDKFDPQIIYCQGYVLTFTWLPVMIHKKQDIPICFQTCDDWPSYLYKKSPFSFAIRPIVNRAITSLLAKSSIRLAYGNPMAKEYFKRYGMSFEMLMQCDSLSRFRKAVPRRVVDKDTISIVYAGGLSGREDAIVDLCKSAEILEDEGFKIMVTAFATMIPPESVNRLRKIDNLQILPGTSHEELPSYLKGADILFLPETFEPVRAKVIHLSISTKAHFYMMSETPVLIYASPVTGIVNYAKEDDWACLVQEQDLNKLTQALRNLITNSEYRKQLVDKGLKTASINHDVNKVRAKFLSILTMASKNYKDINVPENIRYALINWRQHEKLYLPVADKKFIKTGLDVHRAISVKGWIFHKILEAQAGFKILMKSSLARYEIPNRFHGFEYEKWQKSVSKENGVDRGCAAFAFPQNEDKRFTALLWDKEKQSSYGFAKVALDDKTKVLFKNETKALKYFSVNKPIAFSIPEIICQGEFNEKYYLVQTVIPTQTHYLSCLKDMKWAGIINDIIGDSRTRKPLHTLPWWKEFKATTKTTRMLMPLLESKEKESIDVCNAHGDFSPGNILFGQGKAWVFDWEEFNQEAPIMTDYFLFVFENFTQYRYKFVSNRVLAKKVFNYLRQNINNADCYNLSLALAYHSTRRCWTINDDICKCLCEELLSLTNK
jgi:glycosyltransferase involved in cell wall biosynthesis